MVIPIANLEADKNRVGRQRSLFGEMSSLLLLDSLDS